jgi:hypothetical protein
VVLVSVALDSVAFVVAFGAGFMLAAFAGVAFSVVAAALLGAALVDVDLGSAFVDLPGVGVFFVAISYSFV